ncbi:AAA family ATPase [Paractinoplanes atraurantiacus]|uniref:Predicted ATPase n=1 Tax=Paractinoplanes atraurantiacus TaxID=1036182 RepID=A0A285FLS3_9ACTN|nr:AAA family ATPase [Actinoplanes atraurantiacus]SNY12252.1 Predicted ATPase [Actinoplanes atraurantiacus]
MLTRIEIDGFKTFRDFALDLPPFLVVLGRNGTGKSNLFDALRFLSRLASEPVAEAAQHVRGDLRELFHRDAASSSDREMRFAVEVLLDSRVTDAFGETRAVEATRVRYELTIEFRETPSGLRPFVKDEAARALSPGEDRWAARFPVLADRLLEADRESNARFLDTQREANSSNFQLWAGDTVVPAVRIPAGNASATVLSVIGTASQVATLYALRRELESWRQLHLDPTALRRPDGFDDPAALGADGGHLPNTLHRIAETTSTLDQPQGLLGDVSADLASIISDVSGVQVDEDVKRRRREVEFRARGRGEPVSARVASDGTLRAAALLTAAYDPENSGLLCFEEPENGIYPQRLITLVQRLRSIVDRAVDRRAGDPSAPLTQLLLTSHSPAILRALKPVEAQGTRADAVFLTTVSRILPGRSRSRITQPRLIATSARPSLAVQDRREPNERLVSPAEIAEFEVGQALEA